MKIELLKNKQTSIIEKIIINKGMSNYLSDIPFNLTHKQAMIDLDKFDLEWHEMIMEYNHRTNPIKIRARLYKDFDNRELDYLITILDTAHKEHYLDIKGKTSIEQWFFNYYIWTLFFLISKDLKKVRRGKTKIRVVDPSILLFADGIDSFKDFDVFYDFNKAKELFDGIWYHDFNNSFERLHEVFSHHQYNNEKINLEIFKKEVLKLSTINDADWVFWNSKKKMIRELIIDLIKEKIHYSA